MGRPYLCGESLVIVRFTHVTDPIAGTVNLSSMEYRMARWV
jgi:hypothetical protein